MEPTQLGSPSAAAGCSRSSNKRALLCGVRYQQKDHKLRGTTNDVVNMTRLLVERFHFPEDSIRVLTVKICIPEDAKSKERTPTRKNMESSLHWLVEDCKPNDSLVFYFSGHGLRQPDFDGDEIDGFDETLCPSDFKTEGMIVDDYINETLVQPLQKDVKLHAIIDACHSGTVLDLEHVYSKEDKTWLHNMIPSPRVKKGTNGGMAICFSACRDDQMAADTNAFSNKAMNGAMTAALIRAIEKNSPVTYGQLLTSMHETIRPPNEGRCYSFRKAFHRLLLQEPQLSSSEKFNIDDVEFNL